MQTQPKTFQKINLETKNNYLVYGRNTYHTISVMGKMFVIEILYNFLYVWICMELYEKKFPIYENCMTSIFGQPGIDCGMSKGITNLKISKSVIRKKIT